MEYVTVPISTIPSPGYSASLPCLRRRFSLSPRSVPFLLLSWWVCPFSVSGLGFAVFSCLGFGALGFAAPLPAGLAAIRLASFERVAGILSLFVLTSAWLGLLAWRWDLARLVRFGLA